MPESQQSVSSDALTPQEIESLRYAEDAYGALAKWVALEFLNGLEVNEEVRSQILGSVALRLESLDSDRRRQVAHKFRERRFIIRGLIQESDGGFASDILVELQTAMSSSQLGQDDPQAIIEAGGDTDPVIRKDDDEPEEVSPQIAWFALLYDQDSIDKIASFSASQTSQLAELLGERYQELRINKISQEGKQRRAELLTSFMQDESTVDTAKRFGTRPSLIQKDLLKMAAGMSKRVSRSDLDEILRMVSEQINANAQPEGLESTDNGAVVQAAAEQSPQAGEIKLTKSQEVWFSRIYNEADMYGIKTLSVAARLDLVQRLTDHYLSLRITRLSPQDQQVRAAQLQQFMNGKGRREIAEEFDTSYAAINQGLTKMAGSIKSRTDESRLVALLKQAYITQSSINNHASTQEPAASEPIEPGEPLPVGLTKLQQTWYRPLFRGYLQDIEDFTPAQKEELGERLARYARSLTVRRHGTEGMRVRVQQMMELIDGKSVVEIAEILSSDPITVRRELYGLRKLLVKHIPAETREKIMADVQAI